MSAIPASASASFVPRSGAARERRLSLAVLAVAIATLVVGVARSGLYNAASTAGYWMGVVGGSMMLLLLLYPLSKRARALRAAMPVRHWFALHMLFGVLGPLLILLHCTLRIGSLNAAVALWSMVIVASSGVVGRFLYGRLHAGLYGRQRSFAEVAAAAEGLLNNAAAPLAQAPQVLAELRGFAAHANAVSRSGLQRPISLLRLGAVARRCAGRCRAQLLQLPPGTPFNTANAIELAVRRYLDSARDAAQFRAFERIFALWHVLHIPLVAILVLSAIVHIVAVHMY